MKIHEIIETQDFDSLSQSKEFIEKTIEWLKRNGTKWAETLGNRQVIHGSYDGQDIFGLANPDTILAIGVFVDAGEFYELRLITNTTGKAGNFYPMLALLFTVKEYIGKPIIDYGSQSEDGRRFVQALAKSGHFNIAWYNIKTGEKNQYDPSNDEQGVVPYRDVTRTDWRILVECTAQGLEEFPQEGLTPFGTPQDFFTEEYTVWVEAYRNK